jgi:hypothetical protein
MILPLLALSTLAQAYGGSAVYEIPCPPDLKAYASFQVSYNVTKTADGQITLNYALPATLLGDAKAITVQGNADPANPGVFALHGQDADMNCTTSTATVDCNVAHHNTSVNLDKVSKALDDSGISGEDKAGHLKLAAFVAHGGDIIGVIHYNKDPL